MGPCPLCGGSEIRVLYPSNVPERRRPGIRYGCTSCHGFQGQGGVVGKDLEDASASEIRREVRDGPEGMPAYVSSFLSDEDLEEIVAFLMSEPQASAGAPDETTAGDPGHTAASTEGGSLYPNRVLFVAWLFG